MIEVVFSESLKGSLKSVIFNSDKVATDSINSQNVVCFGNNFDIGDISGEIYGEKRKKNIIQMFKSLNFNDDEIEKMFYSESRNLELLLNAANNGEQIRIWKSKSPHSACAFAFLCDALRDIECEIFVLRQPDFWMSSNNEIKNFIDWAEIPPEKLSSFLYLSKKMTDNERLYQGQLWQNLKQENAILRTVLNGQLISVNDDFYDTIINQYIPKDEFMMAQLIGTIMGKNPIGVIDGWYGLRINKMIDHGLLEIVSNNPSRVYGKVLKKRN